MSSDCMLWAGYKVTGDYGRITVANKQHLVHRIFYETFVDKIPEGLTIDHLCGNPPCFNIEHLEPVSLRDNLLRGRTGENLKKTHCPKGHPYSGSNLYLYKGKHRRCRTCTSKATKEWHTKNKLIKEVK